jgi:hypothetical protein
MKNLRERVFAALNRAKENGYDWSEDDPALVAADMVGASDEFENLSEDEAVELQDYILEWQESFLT